MESRYSNARLLFRARQSKICRVCSSVLLLQAQTSFAGSCAAICGSALPDAFLSVTARGEDNPRRYHITAPLHCGSWKSWLGLHLLVAAGARLSFPFLLLVPWILLRRLPAMNCRTLSNCALRCRLLCRADSLWFHIPCWMASQSIPPLQGACQGLVLRSWTLQNFLMHLLHICTRMVPESRGSGGSGWSAESAVAFFPLPSGKWHFRGAFAAPQRLQFFVRSCIPLMRLSQQPLLQRCLGVDCDAARCFPTGTWTLPAFATVSVLQQCPGLFSSSGSTWACTATSGRERALPTSLE